MTKREISDLFDKYEDGYQVWRGDGVMTKGAFIEAVTEALRIHDVVGRSEQLKAFLLFIQENVPNYRTKQLKPEQVIKAYIKHIK